MVRCVEGGGGRAGMYACMVRCAEGGGRRSRCVSILRHSTHIEAEGGDGGVPGATPHGAHTWGALRVTHGTRTWGGARGVFSLALLGVALAGRAGVTGVALNVRSHSSFLFSSSI